MKKNNGLYLRSLPKCGAKARSSEGRPCKQIAMKNGKCHWHGGATKTKHGKETKQAHTQRTKHRQMISEARKATASLISLVEDQI